MRKLGMEDYRAYFEYLVQDESGKEMVHMLDSISTNVTSFFRESQHFDILSSLMREWISSGQKRFRIWSAACSSGEEPYSIAMTMLEAAKGQELRAKSVEPNTLNPMSYALSSPVLDMKVLATDISTRILEKAWLGMYEAEKVKPVRMELRNRYFAESPTAGISTRRLGGEQGRASNSDPAHGESVKRLVDTNTKFYKVTQELMDMVVFKRLNLSSPPFPMRGPLDAIFCRNVMIYFDRAVRCGLLQEIDRLLKPGGYLFIGHAESLTGLVNNLKSVRPSVYLKG